MEKTQNTIDSKFQKKILGFLDGSLSIEEKSEFEAYIRTHPEFEAQIKKKEDELSFLKNLIPVPLMSKEITESLESEMKLSIFNLLKEEPKSFADRVRNSWEEWVSR